MDVFGQGGGREEALELEEERKIRRELVQVRHDLCVKTGKTAQEAATARSEKSQGAAEEALQSGGDSGKSYGGREGKGREIRVRKEEAGEGKGKEVERGT